MLQQKIHSNSLDMYAYELSDSMVTVMSKNLFALRLLLLFIVCLLVRGSRLCKLRRGVFGPADGLWIAADACLCADPLWRLPSNPAAHLRALALSAQWALFLFAGVPLFVAAAERLDGAVLPSLLWPPWRCSDPPRRCCRDRPCPWPSPCALCDPCGWPRLWSARARRESAARQITV